MTNLDSLSWEQERVLDAPPHLSLKDWRKEDEALYHKSNPLKNNMDWSEVRCVIYNTC